MQTRPWRGCAVLVAAGSTVVLSAPAALATASAGLPDGDVDVVAGALAAPLLCALGLWLAVGAAAGLAARVPGALGRAATALHRRLLPRLLRVALAGGAGAGILLAPISAGAAPPHPAGVTQDGQPPIWPLDASASAAPAWPTTTPSKTPTDPPTHTVGAGQSLWLIATQRLGGTATPRQIAAYWPHIYTANRDVIGDDPDLIRPGQVLTLPDPNPQEQP